MYRGILQSCSVATMAYVSHPLDRVDWIGDFRWDARVHRREARQRSFIILDRFQAGR